MKRFSKMSSLITGAAKLLGVGIAVGGAYVAAKEMSGLWRYASMKRMAKRHDGADPSLLPSKDSPQYAQAPRRAGEHDEDMGKVRRAKAMNP